MTWVLPNCIGLKRSSVLSSTQVLRNAVYRKSGLTYIKDTVHGPAHMMQCLGPGARDKWAEEKL